MNLTQHQKAIGVFRTRSEAEAALQELKHSGYAMERVSVIAQNPEQTAGMTGTETHEHIGNKADEGATAGALTGGTLGGLTGLLVGLGTLAIPGVGPILLAGAAATAIATTVAGGAIGAAAGGLIGGLIGLGIPEERAKIYDERVRQGHYLLLVEGTAEEIQRAEVMLHRRGIEEWDVYGHHQPEVVPNRYERPEYEVPRTQYGRPEYEVPSTQYGRPEYEVPDTQYGQEREIATNPVPSMDTPRLGHRRRAVGLFSSRGDAEAALRDLERAHFPKHQVSLVGKDDSGDKGVTSFGDRHEGNLADRTKTDEGAKAGAATGGILGGLGGLLVGLGALAIPGIGPVLAGGALATALATTAAGGAIGAAAGGLTGALVGLGIPDERAHFYNDRVHRGDYLVMVDGDEAEIARAEDLLRRRGIRDWDVFEVGDRESSPALHTERESIGRQTTQLTSQPATIDSTNYVTAPNRTVTEPVAGTRRQAIAVFPHRQGAERAIHELRETGFPLDRVSIIATDVNNNPFTGVKTKNSIDHYESLGIVEREAHDYRDRLGRGQYLVTLYGTNEELERAEARLNHHGLERWEIYQVVSNAPEVIVIDHRHHDRNPNF